MEIDDDSLAESRSCDKCKGERYSEEQDGRRAVAQGDTFLLYMLLNMNPKRIAWWLTDAGFTLCKESRELLLCDTLIAVSLFLASIIIGQTCAPYDTS